MVRVAHGQWPSITTVTMHFYKYFLVAGILPEAYVINRTLSIIIVFCVTDREHNILRYYLRYRC